MVALGANDLTAELGIPGEYDHPLVRDAVAAVAAACRAHGRLFMLGGIGDPAVYAVLAALGACPLRLTGMDTDLLYAAVQAAGRRRTGGSRREHRSSGDHADARGRDQHPAAFSMPAGSCDAHFHVFEPGYPHVPDPLYTFPDATLDQYLALTEVLGISRFVLVQPTFYGTDNRLTLDVLRRVGDRCRAVVRVEEDVTDAELDEFHDLGVRALRLDLFARSAQTTAEIIDYVRRMATRTRPRGWHLQFYTPGRVVRDLLPFLADFDQPYVIDHMGYMKEEDGLTPTDADRLLDVLRDNDNCWIKLSGPYRIAKDKPLSSVHELGRALVATRADRLLWGSDWPHLPNGQRDTGELLNLLADWAPDPRDRRRSWSTPLITSSSRTEPSDVMAHYQRTREHPAEAAHPVPRPGRQPVLRGADGRGGVLLRLLAALSLGVPSAMVDARTWELPDQATTPNAPAHSRAT